MAAVVIRYAGTRRMLPLDAPTLLSALLEQAEVPLAKPCGGAHTCGKCKVRAYGALSPLSQEERRLLTIGEQLENWRLACAAEAVGDCTVEIGEAVSAQIQTAGQVNSWEGSSLFGAEGYALAADIGTTTVAVYLVSLSEPFSGACPSTSELNAQAPYGADVISRIASVSQKGVVPLREAILRQLDRLFISLLETAGVPKQAVRGVVLTGNTTMLHLAAGLDPSGIAAAPYIPQSLFGVLYSARGWFPSLSPAVQVYLAPCISAYLGGDLTCALLSSPLRQWELLIDVGTNGEMALMTPDGLFCCSTAAGPAFEGAGLRCGRIAGPGAIDRVAIREGIPDCRVIGGGPALGICGTGAIHAVAALLEAGLLDETGLLDERYGEEFPLQNGVVLTQQDIRQLQLAKAAIAAGADTLLHHAGVSCDRLAGVSLAGGFGSYIDPAAAMRIGLLPRISAPVVSMGNAAGMGACLCAQSEPALHEAERIAQDARTIELASDPFFNERYIEQMLFIP